MEGMNFSCPSVSTGNQSGSMSQAPAKNSTCNNSMQMDSTLRQTASGAQHSCDNRNQGAHLGPKRAGPSRGRRRPQTNNPHYHHKGQPQPGVSGGNKQFGLKHKQRRVTDALLDEATLAGLDIDLAESIAPSNSSSCHPTSSSGATSEATKHKSSKARQMASRKLNLSHLLNYSYDNPPRSKNSSSRHTGNRYGQPGRRNERPVKFSKQQFLQANCQFVVLTGPDYSVHSADPDWPIDWNLVEEVRFLQCSSTETMCPICLSSPVAAKITRCGHIFCWPCMLHYLSLSDENWRQCPICFEVVYRNDLRSVVSCSYNNITVDDVITLRLMNRSRGCVQVEPYNRPPLGLAMVSSPSDHNECTTRHNLLIVEHDSLLANIIEREQEQLDTQLTTDRNEPEACFIEQALSLLNERRGTLTALIETSRAKREIDAQLNELSLSETPENLARLRQINSIDQTSCRPVMAHSGLSVEGSRIAPAPRVDTETNPKTKEYLFYQSIDGQHIYLNALNTKMLCQEYKSLDKCPLVIKAKVLQMDWISMNEQWRKRYKYLEHLPLTCEFRLIELDLSDLSIVSPTTFALFESDVRKRAAERERRRREERKREKIIQVEQNRKIYGIQPSLTISLDNQEQFPSVMDERYVNSLPKSINRPTHGNGESDFDESHYILSADDSDNGEHNVEAATSVASSEIELDEGLVPCQPSASGTILGPTYEPFSFKAIQDQQEAAAMKTVSVKKKSGWGNSNHSFAQLLTDAKSSEQKWSRFPTNPSPSSSCKEPLPRDCLPNRSRYRSESCDDSNEGSMPAPDYVISNFIEFNVKTSSSKKKGKRGAKIT